MRKAILTMNEENNKLSTWYGSKLQISDIPYYGTEILTWVDR
ncbi:hypothetical protein J2Z76_000991 [Sedimentibacter acidaminivorans]|uniref:Uncharacterized protein n=1 Tax=Sedimentibacter acidaminivorans TaxID=913099 RepID=A0ABS4GBT6_9FIRM|nr:hypothetical protein [Sedimentibacter acidaminivorans]MBP1925134.1 hypothetical protein [Sedimentibacter acidaminivorans]